MPRSTCPLMVVSRHCRPSGPANAFGVKAFGNCSGGLAGGKIPKDASDHQRLRFIDLSLTRFSLHQAVAISLSSRDFAGQRATQLATPSLFFQVGQIKLRHGAEQSHMHRGHLPDIDRMKLDSTKLQMVMQACDIGQSAT